MPQTSPHVMVFGTFDLLHEGHRFVFREALKRGRVTVIVANDANVTKIKGRKPVEDQRVRLNNIQSEFPELSVFIGDSKDFLQPLREHKPDLILLGYDQRLPPGIEEKDLPCDVERLPALDPHLYKSSLMRERD